ncbi:MAG: hypothetical protein RQ728_07480 [Brevefilum sp.]|nr:hypothetical protein [Brevefilum sp.]
MVSILFVCTANRFRSPLAALYFAREIVRRGDVHEIGSASAGTWGVDGLPAMATAVELAKDYSLNLGDHNSRIISEEILSGTDLILVMETGLREGIVHEFPAYVDRVFLLTEAVGEPPSDIDDPYGPRQASPTDVAREIIELISKGYDQIIKLARNTASKDG